MKFSDSYVVLCNYSPSSTHAQQTSSSSIQSLPLLQLWIGEHVKVVAQQGNWFYGHYKSDPTKCGIFPVYHVQPLDCNLKPFSLASSANTSSNNTEAGQLINEITETVKVWWNSLKDRYANECSVESSCDKFVQYIKDLMIIRNKIRSGNVPTGELKEIRLVIARKIDAGNHCMGLSMHIRNTSGKVIRAEQLSVVSAYKQHESALARITSNDFFASNSSSENADENKFAVLLDIGNFCADFASTAPTFELVVCVVNGRTREVLSEPLTMYWSRATKAFNHASTRALFVDLSERELNDDQILLSLVMLRHSPVLEQGGKKGGEVVVSTAHQLRQDFASGQLNISEQLRAVMDKEKREITFNLLREPLEWQGDKLQSQNPVGNCQSSPSSKILNGMTGSAQTNLIYDQNAKVPICITLQLINCSSLDKVQQLHPDLFVCTSNNTSHSTAVLQRLHPTSPGCADWFRRNEVFLRLKIADLHGGKLADKNIEAVICLLDDLGNIVANSVEIVTPDKLVHKLSHHSRVVAHEERPRFNETVKLRLPKYGVKGLHARILFYNKKLAVVANEKAEKKAEKADKGPVAMSFLHIIRNFVLLGDVEEDELLVYRLESGKFDDRNMSYLQLPSSKRQSLNQQRTVASQHQTLQRASPLRTEPPYIVNEKNSVHYQTIVCSTVHTTNSKLLQILRWKEYEAVLKERIRELVGHFNSEFSNEMHSTEEMLKLLPNLLDALFDIAAKLSSHQKEVFEAMVYLIRLCEEPKNCRHKEVLESYVHNLHCPTAHNWLLAKLIWFIDNEGIGSHIREARDNLLPVLKSLGLLVRMAIVSKSREDAINAVNNKTTLETEKSSEHAAVLQRDTAKSSGLASPLDKLLNALSLLMQTDSRRMTCQNAALKYLPSILPSLLNYHLYPAIHLAGYISQLVTHFSTQIVPRQKLVFLQEIVHTQIFACLESRQLLLPLFLKHLLLVLPPPDNTADCLELAHLAAKVLTEILERLFPYSQSHSVFQRGTYQELKLILFQCFRAINQTVVCLFACGLASVAACQRVVHSLLLALLDKFSAANFLEYLLEELKRGINRLDMLSEMLHMFRDLLEPPRQLLAMPIEWYQMRHLQHKLLIKHIRFAKAVIVQQFGGVEDSPDNIGFVPEIWLECMLTLVCFVKQCRCVCSVQPLNTYYAHSTREMRQTAACLLRSLWFSMTPQQKMEMMPEILTSVLQVALYVDDEQEEGDKETYPSIDQKVCATQLREISMPIFYDMLKTEHFLHQEQRISRPAALPCWYESGRALFCNKDSSSSNNFQDLFIAKLDPLLDDCNKKSGGLGFRLKFKEMFCEMLESDPQLQTDIGGQLVQKIDRLLELLLNYRQVRVEADCIENGMFCTVQLVDFYHQIGQYDLYVSYLYKLYELHMIAGNLVEAALTLKKHANLLRWTEEPVEKHLLPKFAEITQKSSWGIEQWDSDSHMQLKKSIYEEMADLFEKGEHWELAVEVLKELVPVYESILFDFQLLAGLMQRLAELYSKITSTIRMEHYYFLVAFYGSCLPTYLRGKSCRKFIFRGEKLEQWNNFKQRMLTNYFGFKFVESMEDCENTYGDAPGKYIQIIPVIPQPSPIYSVLNKSPHRMARWYYKHHQVVRFEQSRRENRSDTKWTAMDSNDATKLWLKRKYISIEKPLPDILKFAQVVNEHEPEPANPVDVAVQKVQEVNETLAETARLVAAGFVQGFLVNLGGCVRGVVQADVGGGIKNYQAFFTDECWRQCTDAERKSILLLKSVLREHVTILEYALYVHASKQSLVNEVFHNSLVQIFSEYRRSIEERFGKAPSILPSDATICLNSFAPSNNEINATTTMTNNSISSSSLHHQTSSQERSISLSMSEQGEESLRQASSASTSTISSCSSATTPTPTGNVLFRHVPSAAALLRMGSGNKSKSGVSTATGTPSTNSTPLKKNSFSVGNGAGLMKRASSMQEADTGEFQELHPHQKQTMLAALRENSACSSLRFSTSSLSEMMTALAPLDFPNSSMVFATSVSRPPTPPLPPRNSTIHSSELRRKN